MSTPDKFFQINPDLKPGAIPQDDNHLKAHRPTNPPQSDKDFQKILEKGEDKPTKDTNEIAKDAPEEKDRVALKDPTTTKAEKLEAFVKETTQPDLDPRFNQAPTVDKDSKVAPKLGKEMTVAPTEEPRAMGYVEGVEKQEGRVTIPGETVAEKGRTEVDADNIVKAMPAEKQAMKLPKGELPERPDNLLAQGKQAADMAPAAPVAKEAPKSPDQLFNTMAKAPKEKIIADAGTETVANKLGPATKEKGPAIANDDTVGKQGQTGTTEGSVNLMSGQGPAHGLQIAAANVPTTTPAQTAQLINQIAEQLSVVETGSKADTTITLKNMPTFEGVRVTVTTYPTARGEINITFENLTQEGKMILDMVDNRAALKQALDQRGYIVHMITTTTTIIERNFAESGGAQKEGRGGTKDEMAGGGGGQQKQDQDRDA